MDPRRALLLLGCCGAWALLGSCAGPSVAEGVTPTIFPAIVVKTVVVRGTDRVFESADDDSPAQSEAAAVQPVVGISQRVKTRSNEKKDLGILGYVLGVIMMSILIAIGAGIVVGYIYKSPSVRLKSEPRRRLRANKRVSGQKRSRLSKADNERRNKWTVFKLSGVTGEEQKLLLPLEGGRSKEELAVKKVQNFSNTKGREEEQGGIH